MSAMPPRDPGRRRPAKGVHIQLGRPNWVFLTVNCKDREPWLAHCEVQTALHQIWKDKATAWLVSDYLLMPDHLHLLCAPQDLRYTIEYWIKYWKDQFSKTGIKVGGFQNSGVHHRLRDSESYSEKWLYIQQNPVRAGLVKAAEEWRYKGRVHEIRFQ